MPSVQTKRITRQIAEGIAADFLLNVPVSQIVNKWGFSKQTMHTIRRGDHPALLPRTKSLLMKFSSKKQKSKLWSVPGPDIVPMQPKPDMAALASENLVLRTMLLDLCSDTMQRLQAIQKACV